MKQAEQFFLDGADPLCGDLRFREQAAGLEIGHRHCLGRRLAHGDRHGAIGQDGWKDELGVFVVTFVTGNRSLASKSDCVIGLVDGLRRVIDTGPSGTTGGRTSWTRSPVGKIVEQIGFSRVTSCEVKAAAARASSLRASRVNPASRSQVQPPCRSTPTIVGSLMTTSVTPSSSRYCRSGRTA